MPTSIRVAGVRFTKVIASLSLPDLKNLALEAVLGGNQSKSVVNRANSAAPLTVVGTPSYSPNYVSTSGGNFGQNGFNTGYLPAGDVTVMAICKVPGGNAFSPLEGSVGGQSILGLELSSSTLSFWNSQWSAGPNNPEVSLSGHGGNFIFIAGAGPLGQPGKVYFIYGNNDDAPTVVTATGQQAGGGRHSGTVLQVGTSATGGGDVAYVAAYDRVLTQAQLIAARKSLKTYYSGKLTMT